MPTVRELALDSNIFSTNEKVVDMDPVLQKTFPDVTPLLSIFNKLADESAKNETIYWSNDEELPTELKYTGASESSAPSAGAGTLDFTNYAYLREDDMLVCPRTGEGILVTATPSSSTVAVYRGWDATVGALLSDETLIITPGAKEEGGAYMTARSVVNSEDYNYVQEFDEFVRMSTLADLESTHFGGPGSKFDADIKKMQRVWAKKMENGIWLGVRAKTLLSGETGYRRSMKGIASWLRSGTNYKNVNGLLTESLFNSYLQTLYTTYPDKTNITVFASPFVYGIVSQWGRNKIQTSPNQTTYGLRTDRYVGDIDVDLIRCPMWTDTTRKGWAFAIDLPRIKMKYMAHPRLQYDVQLPYANEKAAKYYTALTIMFANEAAHSMWVGING